MTVKNRLLMNLVTVGAIGRILGLARKLARRLRTRGVPRTLYSVAWRVASLPGARRLVRLGAADLFRLAANHRPAAPRVPACFQVRWIDATEADIVAEYFGDERRVGTRFERGDRCAVTTSGGRIGAGVWIAAGPGCYDEDRQDLGFGLAIPDRAIFTYDGKGTRWGAWGALMARLPELLAEEDVEQVFTLIDCNNWLSLDSHQSLGYQRLGSLLQLGTPRYATVFWIPKTKPFNARRLIAPLVDLARTMDPQWSPDVPDS
jgi:hypothetical protein